MKQANILVALLMGSKSDAQTVSAATAILRQFEIPYEARVLSAHRTPRDVAEYVAGLPARGCRVVIAAAGMSAALAGTVAAHTTLPVIGVPMETTMMGGMDSLLSTVQMPKGIPVACMAVGKAGAANAGLFAAQIVALQDTALAERLRRYKEEMAAAVRAQTLDI